MIGISPQRQSERLSLPVDPISAPQCRGARAMLGWSQTQLAEAAKVARQTVVDFERGARTPYPNNLTAIRAALEAAGVEFIAEDGSGAGVRLRKP
nr:helix-turn-helix transcriptional regulator [Roseomonas sp. KE0001]